MSKKLGLLTIHGMGETERGYYEDFKKSLESSLNKNIWSQIEFEPIFYQSALQDYQDRVWENMRKNNLLAWQDVRKFMLFGFSDASSMEHRANSDRSVYKRTQKTIFNSLRTVREELETNNKPLLIVAHSLGCQVISNYIWDAQSSKGIWQVGCKDYPDFKAEQEDFLKLKNLSYLFTTGCNIPLFVAAFEEIIAIDKPNPNFQWLNYYDKDDVLGWPLKSLSPSYNNVVDKDIEMDSGKLWQSWNPQSHNGYWTDDEFIKPLSKIIQGLVS
jgi:Serine hydrolase